MNDPLIINKIFEFNNNKIELLVSQDSLLAIKVKNYRIDNYKFDKKNYNELNSTLAKSFFNDFSNLYIQNLANKHKLKRNYEEIKNYFNNTETTN